LKNRYLLSEQKLNYENKQTRQQNANISGSQQCARPVIVGQHRVEGQGPSAGGLVVCLNLSSQIRKLSLFLHSS
jgi:hypothetical protein